MLLQREDTRPSQFTNRTSRSGLNQASRLRRSNSTISYIIRSEQIDETQRCDPDIAREYAIVAANTAFEMARDLRENENNRRVLVDNSSKQQPLRERRSVRFTGPNAVSDLNRPITRRQAKTWEDVSSESKVRLTQPCDKGLSLREASANLTALPSLQSPSMPESSYRKLKKAKSMFNPRKEQPEYFVHATPRTPFSHSPKGRVIATTGLSPDRPPPTAEELLSKLPNCYQSTYSQDSAVRMARDAYLRQLAAEKTEESTPLTSGGTASSQQKPFPRSVRSGSVNSFGPAIGCEPLSEPPKKKCFSIKSRKASWNLKDKLKRVFTRNPGNTIPAQQINARRAHYRNCSPEPKETPRMTPDIPLPDPALLSRVSSRASSIAHLPMAPEVWQRRPSAESEESAKSNTLRSRVTSWTNSTMNSNPMSQKQMAREKKRLTIIQEHGAPYQPSTSASSSLGSARYGYAAFRKPLRVGKSAPPLNSQRVFSALQKRIDEKKRFQIEEASDDEDAPGQGFQEVQATREMQLSIEAQNTGRTTIRLVNDSSQEEQQELRAIRHSKSFNLGYIASRSTDDVFRPSRTPSNGRKSSRTPSASVLSFQQAADENERPLKVEKKRLRQSNSTFFPPQRDYLPERVSPFRRAMRASVEEQRAPLRRIENRERHFPEPAASNRSSIDSASVYSRDTNGISVLNEPANFRNHSNGDFGIRPAEIIDTKAIVEQYSAVLNRDSSSTSRAPSSSKESSGDWKGWMASQVAKLEDLNKEKMTIRNPSSYRNRKSRHRREYAQIHDEDIEIDENMLSEGFALQTSASTQTTSRKRPETMQRPSSQLNENRPLRYPLYPLKKSPSIISASSILAKPPPVMETSSVSGARQSSNQNINYPNEQRQRVQPAPILSKRASEPVLKMKATHKRTFGPAAGTMQPLDFPSLAGQEQLREKSSANLNRASPERAARLRRVKSSALIGAKEDARALNTIRWARNQQENHAINSVSPLSRLENSPHLSVPSTTDSPNGGEGKGSSRMVELFLSSRRAVDGRDPAAPAFI